MNKKLSSNVDRWQVVRQLLQLSTKESSHLLITAKRIRACDPDLSWIQSLDTRVEDGEMLDAFVARFGRLQDTLGDKLLPALLRASLESTGSQLDNLLRAEKMGWIESSDHWITIRMLRNRLIHEYMRSPGDLLQALHEALDSVEVLVNTQQRFETIYRTLIDKPEGL